MHTLECLLLCFKFVERNNLTLLSLAVKTHVRIRDSGECFTFRINADINSHNGFFLQLTVNLSFQVVWCDL